MEAQLGVAAAYSQSFRGSLVLLRVQNRFNGRIGGCGNDMVHKDGWLRCWRLLKRQSSTRLWSPCRRDKLQLHAPEGL